MSNLTEQILSENMIDVSNPYDNSQIACVAETDAAQIEQLLCLAHTGASVMRALSRAARAKILECAAEEIKRESERFAQQITAESGKTILQARKEVERCINTLKLSAEESRRVAGEVIPFDSYSGSEQRMGWFTREPLGIITAITPFNDPLNLVAHKLGPAIAAGNSVLLKPSELTPLSAISLVETLIKAGLPDTAITLVVGKPELGQALVSARDVRMVSFTGGFRTGEAIANCAGLKKLAMDLGGNAPVIVMADADLEKAIERCVSGAFWSAGQNCIGAQRIIIERPIYDHFCQQFVAQSKLLVTGDPSLETTDVGPMISDTAAIQAESRVTQALAMGAELLLGHCRQGALYTPTVLANVPHEASIWQEEAFAPIVILEPFDDYEQAISIANSIDFSLQAGIFTANLETALDASSRIDAGGVMINDSSDYRFDAMPFGGFKYGSLGREGVRFAFEEMTQPKVICINRG